MGKHPLAFLWQEFTISPTVCTELFLKSEDLMQLAGFPLALFLHTMSVDHTLNIVTGSFFALLLANMPLSVAGRFVKH